MTPQEANIQLKKDFPDFLPFENPNVIMTTRPRAYYVPIDKYQQYKFWSFRISENGNVFKDLKLLTAMGNGEKNGMVMKVFGTTWNGQPTESTTKIPEPVNYIYSKEQNPPSQ